MATGALSHQMMMTGYNSVGASPANAARAQDSLKQTFFENMGARDTAIQRLPLLEPVAVGATQD